MQYCLHQSTQSNAVLFLPSSTAQSPLAHHTPHNKFYLHSCPSFTTNPYPLLSHPVFVASHPFLSHQWQSACFVFPASPASQVCFTYSLVLFPSSMPSLSLPTFRLSSVCLVKFFPLLSRQPRGRILPLHALKLSFLSLSFSHRPASYSLP